MRDIKKGLGWQLGKVVGCLVSHRHEDHARSLNDLLTCGIRVLALADVFDAAALKTASRLGCASIHFALDGLEAAHVAAARAAGLEVLVYTVNRLSDARRLVGWGVNGSFTDRYDLLLDAIG